MIFSRHRIFILALFLSLIWHIFWMSAIKVVVTLSGMKPIRFSKVSFLGPILDRGAIEVRIEPAEKSFLETRYIARILNPPQPIGQVEQRIEKNEPGSSDERLVSLIEESLHTPKLEPISLPE